MNPAEAGRLYVIDTCSLTELRRTYPRKGFPHVWALVDKLASEGRLISVEEVAIELEAYDDEVSEWAADHEAVFLPLSEKIQIAARLVLARFPTLVDVKKRKSSADPFVIATAIVNGAVVVTEEKPSGGPPKVKIPDVCKAMNIECLPLLQMLLAEGLGSGS